MISPVSQPESSEARNVTTFAMSDWRPDAAERRHGDQFSSRTRSPRRNKPAALAPSLSVAPGLTELTRIFRGASSLASTPVMASRALLLAA